MLLPVLVHQDRTFDGLSLLLSVLRHWRALVKSCKKESITFFFFISFENKGFSVDFPDLLLFNGLMGSL